jgi:hypothetical protein
MLSSINNVSFYRLKLVFKKIEERDSGISKYLSKRIFDKLDSSKNNDTYSLSEYPLEEQLKIIDFEIYSLQHEQYLLKIMKLTDLYDKESRKILIGLNGRLLHSLKLMKRKRLLRLNTGINYETARNY